MTSPSESSLCPYAQPGVQSIVIQRERKLSTRQTHIRESGPVPIINALKCERKIQFPPSTWALKWAYMQYIPNREQGRDSEGSSTQNQGEKWKQERGVLAQHWAAHGDSGNNTPRLWGGFLGHVETTTLHGTWGSKAASREQAGAGKVTQGVHPQDRQNSHHEVFYGLHVCTVTCVPPHKL